METDLTKEKEFGTEPKPAMPRRVANLEQIINSHKTLVDLVLEDGSVIEAKYLGALGWETVMRKYPSNISILNADESKKLEKAYKKRKDDDFEWLESLSEDEKVLVAKVVNSDTNAVNRTAMILSLVAVNPKCTEETALALLGSFQDPLKFANFCASIQKLADVPECELKNS